MEGRLREQRREEKRREEKRGEEKRREEKRREEKRREEKKVNNGRGGGKETRRGRRGRETSPSTCLTFSPNLKHLV